MSRLVKIILTNNLQANLTSFINQLRILLNVENLTSQFYFILKFLFYLDTISSTDNLKENSKAIGEL